MVLRGTHLRVAAATGSLLIALGGLPAAGQDASPGASDVPGASEGTSVELCARFHQEATQTSRIGTLGLAQAASQSPEPGASEPSVVQSCRLPSWDPTDAWPFRGTIDREQAFHWSLAGTDGVTSQGDIVGVGWAPIQLTAAQARRLVRADAFHTFGAADRAIRAGSYLLVQIETAATPELPPDLNRAFYLGTDRDGDRSNDRPATAQNPYDAFQGLQNLYLFQQLAGRRTPTLTSTDFGSDKRSPQGSVFHNDDVPFAARITETPPGVQFLLRRNTVGDTFRPIVLEQRPSSGLSGPRIASIAGVDMGAPLVLDQDGSPFADGYDVGFLEFWPQQVPLDGQIRPFVSDIWLDTQHQPPVEGTILGLTFQGEPILDFSCPSRTDIWAEIQATQEQISTLLYDARVIDERLHRELTARLDWLLNASSLQQTVRADLIVLDQRLFLHVPVCHPGGGLYGLTDIEFGPTGDADVDVILGGWAGELSGMPFFMVDPQHGGTTTGNPDAFDQAFQALIDDLKALDTPSGGS